MTGSAASQIEPSSSRWRRLRRVGALALSLVWRASGPDLKVLVSLQIAGAAALLAQLFVLRRLLDELVAAENGGASFGTFAPELAALLALTLIAMLVGTAAAERERVMTELVERHAMGRVLDVTARVPFSAFEDPSFHDRLQRARHNALTRPWQLVSGVTNIAGASLSLAGVVVVLATVAPWLPVILALAYAPLWLATNRNSRALYAFTFGLTQADRERRYLESVMTGVAEAKELRTLRAVAFLRRRHDDLYARRIDDLRAVVARRLRGSFAAIGGSTVISMGAVALIVWMTTRTDGLSLARAGVAVVAVQQVGARLRLLGQGAGSLLECSLFLEDYAAFLDLDLESPATADRPATGAVRSPLRHLEVRAVTFRYPGRDEPALDGVSLDVRRGEVIALVGANGSGKTTLVKLLCGLYEPQAGVITWDGVDVTTLDRGQLRDEIAVVFQDFVRYQLTARANIAVGRHERFDEIDLIRAAARQAGAERMLDALPAGFDTILTPVFEGGTDLSGGQWQRVAIARALFRDASLLILDEPSASLDAVAERELFAVVRAVAADRAVVLVSHRASTIQSADRIYVMVDGRIVESGSHSELLAAGGHYTELSESVMSPRTHGDDTDSPR